MAIDYTMTVQDKILTVHAWGFDESLEQVKQYGIALIEACVVNGVTHVLCDERDLEYRLSTIDTYEEAEFISAHAPHVARVAIIPNEKYVQDAQFWETVAVNRGLLVRMFQDPGAARVWLLEL